MKSGYAQIVVNMEHSSNLRSTEVRYWFVLNSIIRNFFPDDAKSTFLSFILLLFE